MSFQAMAWAIKQSDLPALHKLTLVVLANRQNEVTGQCNPSLDTIAKDCGITKSAVKIALRNLRAKGLISSFSKKAGSVYLSNEYKLNVTEEVGCNTPQGGAPETLPVGHIKPQGGAQYARGVGHNMPPKQEIETRNETILKNKAQTTFVLPDFIPPHLWNDFEEMRRKLRKPLTDKARELTVRELIKLQEFGNDPVAVLEQSIANSWQGVFPLKNQKGISPNAFNGNRSQQRTAGNVAALHNVLESLDLEVARDSGGSAPGSHQRSHPYGLLG